MGEANTGGKASWEPIAVLGGGGGPRPLDEGGVKESPGVLPTPQADVSAQQATLELERKRLELDRERLQLEREKLELERARLSLAAPAAAPPPPASRPPVAPPPAAPAAIGSAVVEPPATPTTSASGRRPRTSRVPARGAPRQGAPNYAAAVLVVVAAIGAGSLVVVVATRDPPPPVAATGSEAEADQRLRSIELEERRVAATRIAEAELEAARRAQLEAQRSGARRARELEAQEAAARAQAAAGLEGEVDGLRGTIEQGEPKAFAAAVARLRAIGKDRAADAAVALAAEHALRDVEDQRARCLARAVTAAHRLADQGSFAAATARLEEAKHLGLPLPASALDEAARWPARARAQEEAAARGDAEQRRVAAARASVLEEALARARIFYEARRVDTIRCPACKGAGCKSCTRGVNAEAAARMCAMLSSSAQEETGDWSTWAPTWPGTARGLLGPSLAIRESTTCEAEVFVDRVVTTTTVAWDTRPEATSEHVLVWVRERPGAKLVIRGAEPPPVVVSLY